LENLDVPSIVGLCRNDLTADQVHLRACPDLQDWMARTAACQQAPDGQIWTQMDEIFRL
jgi:L-rhamnose mutarotase